MSIKQMCSLLRSGKISTIAAGPSPFIFTQLLKRVEENRPYPINMLHSLTCLQSPSPTYFLLLCPAASLLLSLSPPSFSPLETNRSHQLIDHTNLLCDLLPNDAPRKPGLLHAVLCLLSSCVSQSSIVVLSTSGSFSCCSNSSSTC